MVLERAAPLAGGESGAADADCQPAVLRTGSGPGCPDPGEAAVVEHGAGLMVGDERNADDPELDRGLAVADVDECCFAT